MKNQLNILNNELRFMNDAKRILAFSFDKCRIIGLKEEYTDEELESLDSLTSRFARLSDIIIQKVMRSIERVDLESEGTTRDTINRSEKKGLINSADLMIEVRELRNIIAHEYLPSAFNEISEKVIQLTPFLFQTVSNINLYCKTKYNL